MRSRKIPTFVILLICGLVLTACSLTGGSSTPDEDVCYGLGKSITGNTELKAVLSNYEDHTDTEKRKFTIEEVKGYAYGMMGSLGDEVYYGTYELCNVDTGELVEAGEYVFEGWTEFPKKSNPDSVGEGSGNTTKFTYEVDGEVRGTIETPGTYVVNTFTAPLNGKWELSDSLEFEVTE